ncbi:MULTISPECIES: Cof-type HAD-IIB family hydrolase [unclassified Microbacterium]|uniref:Cof-type HAD-IIB family hydrolase n=1 Tax=unclassified Microbacterium TaxID=2609290 RepID=UPI00301745FE
MTDIDSRRRIVFIDIDGTILEHGSRMSSSTPAAIAAARANGHLVYLCTGRSAGDINPRVREIPVDGAITNGGAFAVRGSEQIVAHPMPRPLVDRMVAYFVEHDAHYFLQTDQTVYVSPGVLAYAAEFRRAAHPPVDGVDDRAAEAADTDLLNHYRPLDEVDLDAVVKATFLSTSSDTLDRAADELGPDFHVIPGSIPLPGGSNGEICQQGVNKGAAILEVLDALGMDPADAVGIGDSWNDVEMFQTVGTAVAMGNADPELQAMADLVTTGVLDDGIHNALRRLSLI